MTKCSAKFSNCNFANINGSRNRLVWKLRAVEAVFECVDIFEITLEVIETKATYGIFKFDCNVFFFFKINLSMASCVKFTLNVKCRSDFSF